MSELSFEVGPIGGVADLGGIRIWAGYVSDSETNPTPENAVLGGYDRPRRSAASLVPSTRLVIFWKAMSRAKSGEPCLGFSSMLNGEKPQSSVEPSRSFGMKFAARHQRVADLLGVSTRGFCGLITPM